MDHDETTSKGGSKVKDEEGSPLLNTDTSPKKAVTRRLDILHKMKELDRLKKRSKLPKETEGVEDREEANTGVSKDRKTDKVSLFSSCRILISLVTVHSLSATLPHTWTRWSLPWTQ